MHRDTRTLVRAAFATVLGVLSLPLAGSTGAHAQTPPPYNPYPSGILPANLDSERSRIQREITTIFGRYFAEWQALTPTPTNVGNPPILAPNGYDAQRILGGLLNFDLNISPFRNIACASCHMPYTAFSGPIPSVNLTMIAYAGSYPYRAAKRTAQRYP
jgi:cytochrome c peroxidase